MLNQVIIAGVVKEEPLLKKTSSGLHYANLIVEVKKEFRNTEGNYDSDVFSILLWRSVAEHCISICKEGNLVAIKGRLQSSLFNREDGSVFYNYEIIADKVFFLEQK